MIWYNLDMESKHTTIRLCSCLCLAALCGCQYAPQPQQTTELKSYLDFVGELARTPADPDFPADFAFGPSATTYEFKRDYKVVYADEKYVSFRAEEYAYTGGAHGGTKITVGTFDRKTGKILKLADVVPSDRLSPLTKALRAAVVAKLGGEDQLQSEVRPHDNFYIAADGLHFVYNEYEVASYAAGAVEVVASL